MRSFFPSSLLWLFRRTEYILCTYVRAIKNQILIFWHCEEEKNSFTFGCFLFTVDPIYKQICTHIFKTMNLNNTLQWCKNMSISNKIRKRKNWAVMRTMLCCIEEMWRDKVNKDKFFGKFTSSRFFCKYALEENEGLLRKVHDPTITSYRQFFFTIIRKELMWCFVFEMLAR